MNGNINGDELLNRGLKVTEFDSRRMGEFGFRYREVHSDMPVEEQKSHINTVAYNAIFFQLDGELEITWGEYENVRIKPGEMFFLPRGANVSACILNENLKYVVLRLEHRIDGQLFGDLRKIKQSKDSMDYRFMPIVMKRPMVKFANSIKSYLLEGVDIMRLHKIKIEELRIIIQWYFSLEDCAQLFYPVIKHNSAFEDFILDNYKVSLSIEELVSKSNMSRSTFDRKFKECFGMTALKWIEEQTRQLILSKASEPNVSIKDIMHEVAIYNPSQFTHLCKRLCGMPPSKLIRMG